MTGIWLVYACHITSGGLFLPVLCLTLTGLPGLPSAPGRFRPGIFVYLFGFGDRKSTNTGLGPVKVPQPGVDLINMAAPELLVPLAWAVGTPEFKGLLLSRSILVWNCRGGIAMKEALKEWHPPQKVSCPANVESRDRRAFIQLSYSVRLHGPRGMKAKILKGAEENQVDINV